MATYTLVLKVIVPVEAIDDIDAREKARALIDPLEFSNELEQWEMAGAKVSKVLRKEDRIVRL